MWCPKCQADVAGEVTPDHKRVRCANCSTEISRTSASTAADKTQEARELLERWSSARMADKNSLATPDTIEKSISTTALTTTEPAKAPTTKPHTESATRPHFRPGRPKAVNLGSGAPTSAARRGPRIAQGSAIGESETTKAYRVDSMQEPSGPHFDVRSALNNSPRSSSNWNGVVGHLLSYAGVALLTVGTVLVLWGYFGGPTNYTPTGWLVATIGQMLLFLGIVTIVSGGMEHTTQEVCRRIDSLGDRMLRVEQASRDHALRGPSISADRFIDDDIANDSPAREHANRS
jgi:hypothetical protein